MKTKLAQFLLTVITVSMILLLFSCDSYFLVEPRFKPYYDSFKHDAAIRGVIFEDERLSITTKKDLHYENGKAYGLTIYEPFQTTIYLDSLFCATSPDKIGIVLYHELGHAILGRQHSNKNSIMNIRIPWGGWPKSLEVKKVLLDELFKK